MLITLARMLKYWIYSFLIFSMSVLTSCQWEAKKPSFLVIAVDSLPFDAIHCNETEKWKGFKTVCNEMIRFTHAYTPSILSQPALTSVLTGKYPFEHGVWNNGSSFLSAKWKTSAEMAFAQGYKTLFISGGPPIWRKSGLDQGFEIFDDNIFLDYGKYYRPAFENFRIFQDWSSSVVKDSPFFSFIYLSDLQFPEVPTIENDGYAREATYDGQLHEIDESLQNLFANLKSRNEWKDTWIFIVGLNGRTEEARPLDFQGTNLFHENTNVALFVKPAQNNVQDLQSWTVDSNVILTDVGRTVMELLGQDYKETTNTLFKTISLKDVLAGNKDSKSEKIAPDRILLTESGWPQWRKVGGSLFALQKDNYLMLYQNPPKLYNTLIDRNQTFPIDVHMASMQVLTDTAHQLLSLLNADETPTTNENVIQKFKLAHQFFRQKDFNDEVLKSLKALYKKTNDAELAGWLARYDLDTQNWKELLERGTERHQPDWIWAASKNLGTVAFPPNSCVGLFDNLQKLEGLKDPDVVCNDSLVLDFINWMKNRRKADVSYYRDAFMKSYKIFKTDLEIQKLNMENGYTWDVSKDKISKPQNIELILSLSDLAKYKKVLDNEF